MPPLVLRAAAAADVEEAYGWYENQRAGLGEEFLASVQSALEAILAHREAAPIIHRDTRRVLVKRFPYGTPLPRGQRADRGGRVLPRQAQPTCVADENVKGARDAA